ncbi:conserved protein of unknown function [Bradyrhizobium sp. ORS 285]|uniref:hypothetical protein n=1 Tax=Bradyrhizobium sp. ORS 285 TaxID=115808 RepID=UPI000240677E|nr:hypothetical protein [Bradyrhizobium sp. ORS 285]CCD86057.1 conserved hypothetical protein [Bradyrhizobium sp. ORS 285]SMX61355.1 conserved protein of unknown function [Bradyrhizobium sp. ORS 285]
MARPSIVTPRRAAPVFICRKCLKRSDDAKGIKKGIKKAIKREARLAASSSCKPPRLIMTSCFGLCPKRAVVITGGACAARGDYVLVATSNDVAGALARLNDDQNRSS